MKKSPFIVLTRAEYDRLREIERQAKWVIKGRQISRQAALNCLADLSKAVGNPHR